MIIIVTGAGGVGKSTLIEGLKQTLPADEYDIHDIDEGELWGDDANYKAWKQAKIEHHLELSKKNDQKGIDTILCGIIYPQNVLNSEVYEGASARFILLNANPDTIADRLRGRHTGATEGWLREAELGHGQAALSLKETFSSTPGVELREKPLVGTIDTSGMSPQEVLSKVVALFSHS